MKNSGLIVSFVLGLVLSLVLLSFVSAQSASGVWSGQLSDLIGSLSTELIGKILLGFILFMLIYSIVDQIFKGSKTVNLLISLAIALLGMLFMPANFVGAIRDQYGVMAAAILTVIPFAIMLVFTIKLQSGLLGRILWVFYCIYYFALFIQRIIETNTFWTVEYIPYVGAIIGGIMVFFFMPAIRRAIIKGQMDDLAMEGKKTVMRAKLLKELEKENLKAYDTSVK